MIVVTAPTGTIGRQVLANIIGSGKTVRVIARDPARIPAPIRQRVEVIEGSHSQADVVEKAFDGADRVFWLVPADPRATSAEAAYVDFARAGCEAFERFGVKHVVGISALGRGWKSDAGHVTATLRMDDLIATTGVNYRALACASLMENVLRQLATIRDQDALYGTLPGDQKEPACATRDVAALAARLLLDPSWSGVDSVPMLGPEHLSSTDMAAIISGVTGKQVDYRVMPMDVLRRMLTERGASEGMAQAMIDMATAKNEGMDHLVERTADLSALCPTGFHQWCEEVLKPALPV